MAFASIFEHGSSAFIFASTSSDQICVASRNCALSFIEKKSFAPSNLADTVQPIPAAYSQLCLVVAVKLRQVASCELQCSTLGGRSWRSKAFYSDIANTSREEA